MENRVQKPKSKLKDKYEKHLKTEKWANTRQLKAKEQNFTCEMCGVEVLKGFHIHHKTYKHLGNEKLEDLMFLCENCHKNIHIVLKAQHNNKKKKPQNQKACNTCFFSKIIRYKGKIHKDILYCTYHLKECDVICKNFKKGAKKRFKKQ